MRYHILNGVNLTTDKMQPMQFVNTLLNSQDFPEFVHLNPAAGVSGSSQSGTGAVKEQVMNIQKSGNDFLILYGIQSMEKAQFAKQRQARQAAVLESTGVATGGEAAITETAAGTGAGAVTGGEMMPHTTGEAVVSPGGSNQTALIFGATGGVNATQPITSATATATGTATATATGTASIEEAIAPGMVVVPRVAKIIIKDIVCSNGVIHIIDKILVMPSTPFNTLRSAGLTDWVEQAATESKQESSSSSSSSEQKAVGEGDLGSLTDKRSAVTLFWPAITTKDEADKLLSGGNATSTSSSESASNTSSSSSNIINNAPEFVKWHMLDGVHSSVEWLDQLKANSSDKLSLQSINNKPIVIHKYSGGENEFNLLNSNKLSVEMPGLHGAQPIVVSDIVTSTGLLHLFSGPSASSNKQQ